MATTQEAFQLALDHHRNGRLREAETLYRQILSREPRHASTLHFLGLLTHQVGRADLSIPLLREAIAIDPTHVLYHNSLGEALRSLGQLDEAQRCFQESLRLDPRFAPARYHLGLVQETRGDDRAAQADFEQVLQLGLLQAEAHNSLGSLFRRQGDLARASEHYRQAIKLRDQFSEAHNNLGNVLLDQGNVVAAIAELEHAARLQPSAAQIQFNLGNAVRAGGQQKRALACYRESLRLAPNFAAAYNNLGTLLKDLGHQEEAERAMAEAIRIDPTDAETHYNLGTFLQNRKAFDEARACHARAIALNPNHAEAHLNLGMALQSQSRWEEARACYHEALRIQPRFAGPLCNLGILDLAIGQDDQALDYFNRTLDIQADNAEAHFNRGVLLLGRGDYAAGWNGYAWYSQCESRTKKFDQPNWDGSPLEGRTIYVHFDHGMGDTLHYIRFLSEVRKRGPGKVLYSAQPALYPLLEQSGWGEGIVPENTSIEFDLHLSGFGLPCVFRALAEPFPNTTPYLRTTDDLIEQWREKLSTIGGFKIGIGWQGNRDYSWDVLRSIPLAEFEPLARIPGVRLICLQQGPGREQLHSEAARLNLVDLGDAVDSPAEAFMNTAAIMKNLDLVITSDTALAHLAGALAVPTWVALSYAPEWRWGRRGEKQSPWYPTMRLFRQSIRNNWTEVFTRIADELKPFCLSVESPPSDRRPSS